MSKVNWTVSDGVSNTNSHSQTVSQLHQVLAGFSDLNEMCIGKSSFYGLHFT
jgi:hypothetical protein